MKILPAIDIKDGQAVRLFKGDFSQKTVVNPDVLEQARVFKEAGVTMIHVVDLDGALTASLSALWLLRILILLRKRWSALEAAKS